MEEIRRNIKLFLVSYGKLFAYIAGFIFAVIFTIQVLNSLAIEQNKIESIEYQNRIEKVEKQNKHKEYITQFINYCNKGNVQNAYEMLSEKCKQEKYDTVEKFEKEYINKIFCISICEYEIKEENGIYTVILTQDMLITGKNNSTIEEKYKIEGILEDEIYICN